MKCSNNTCGKWVTYFARGSGQDALAVFESATCWFLAVWTWFCSQDDITWEYQAVLAYGVPVNRWPWLGVTSSWLGRQGWYRRCPWDSAAQTIPTHTERWDTQGTVGITRCELLPGLLPIAEVRAVDPLAFGQLANIGCISQNRKGWPCWYIRLVWIELPHLQWIPP